MLTIENNKLIAEFVGYKVDENIFGGIPVQGMKTITSDSDTMKFHSNWNWIMPVIEKINANVNYYISNGIPETGKKYNCAVYVSKDFKTESRNRLIEIDDNTSQIDVTYRVVVEFIKWYNANSPS